MTKERIALISAPGSRGDVNPMLGLAAELRRRSWRVHVAISEPYAHLVGEIGCEAKVIVTQDQFQSMLGQPNLWRPVRGFRLIFRHAVSGFGTAYMEQLPSMVVPQQTVLIAHPLDFASRVYHLAHPSIPLLSVHLAPATLFTPRSPSRYTALPFEIRRPEWLVRSLYVCANRLFVRRWITGGLDKVWQSAGVTPIRQDLHLWWSMGQRTLGFFPEWFGPPRESYLSPMELVGFPLADGGDVSSESRVKLEQLISDLPAPPIVFTAGTAHQHARDFYKAAAETCKMLQLPGLLLASQPNQFPDSLPEHVRTASYVPFAELLPRCRLLVHHGGIGTTSQAMAAGIPQLVVPMAFDQFDNGERVTRLGCGDSLIARKLTPSVLQTAIKRLLGDEKVRLKAIELSRQMDGPSAIRRAADLVELLHGEGCHNRQVI